MLLKPNVKENKQTNNLISNNFVISVCVCTSVTKSVKSNENREKCEIYNYIRNKDFFT